VLECSGGIVGEQIRQSPEAGESFIPEEYTLSRNGTDHGPHAGENDNIASHLEVAASFIKNILDTRKAWYTGKWEDWFKDERKLNIQYIYDFTLKEKERFEAN
jgi:hypothetical protein